jgi:hypothetical protein
VEPEHLGWQFCEIFRVHTLATELTEGREGRHTVVEKILLVEIE